jgi:hypothetical protein
VAVWMRIFAFFRRRDGLKWTEFSANLEEALLKDLVKQDSRTATRKSFVIYIPLDKVKKLCIIINCLLVNLFFEN